MESHSCFFSCGTKLQCPWSYTVQLQEGQPITSTDMGRSSEGTGEPSEMKEKYVNGENKDLEMFKLKKKKNPPVDNVS